MKFVMIYGYIMVYSIILLDPILYIYIYMHISFSIGSDPKKWKKDQFH